MLGQLATHRLGLLVTLNAPQDPNLTFHNVKTISNLHPFIKKEEEKGVNKVLLLTCTFPDDMNGTVLFWPCLFCIFFLSICNFIVEKKFQFIFNAFPFEEVTYRNGSGH